MTECDGNKADSKHKKKIVPTKRTICAPIVRNEQKDTDSI